MISHSNRYIVLTGFLIILVIIISWGSYDVIKTGQVINQSSKLYQHPFTVTKSVRRIELELKEIQLELGEIHHDTVIDRTADIHVALDNFVQKTNGDIEILKERFMGDPNLVIRLESLITGLGNYYGESAADHQAYVKYDNHIVPQFDHQLPDFVYEELLSILNEIKQFADHRASEFYTENNRLGESLLQSTYLVFGLITTLILAVAIVFFKLIEKKEKAVLDSNHQLKERVKELKMLNYLSGLMQIPSITIGELLGNLIKAIPDAWQYPEITAARIQYRDETFTSDNFQKTPWILSKAILLQSENVGKIEVVYLEARPPSDEGPFTHEERALINSLAQNLGAYLERIESELKLAESEASYKSLVDSSPVCLYEIDVKHIGGLFYSDQCFSISGYSADQLIQQPDLWLSIIHDEDKEQVMSALDGFKNGVSFDFTYRIRHKDGGLRWVKDVSINSYDPRDNVLRGLVLDITKEQVLIQELEESKELLSEAQRLGKVGTWTEDLENNKTWWSDTMKTIHGLEVDDETPGVEFYSRIDSDDLKEMMEKFENARATGSYSAEYLVQKYGTDELIKIRSTSNVRYDEQGKPVMHVGFSQDITQEANVRRLVNASIDLYDNFVDKSYEDLIQQGVDTSQHLLDSEMAFFHLVNEDQETIQLAQWSSDTKKFCTVPDLATHYPIKDAGVWVECVGTKKPVVHNDYESLTNKHGLPEGHVRLVRDLEVPIIENGLVRGIIGVGNKQARYSDLDVEQLTAFSVTFWSILQRKKEIAEIESQRKRLDTIISNIPGMVFMRYNDDDFHMMFLNEYSKSVTGYTPPELNADKLVTYSSLILPEDLPNLKQVLNNAFETKSKYTINYRITNREGNIRWLYEAGEFEFYDAIKPIINGIIYDITDNIHAEEKKMREIIKTADEERSRISQNIHDGLQQTLISAQMNLSGLRDNLDQLNEKSVNRYLNGMKILNESINETRSIAHSLFPKQIEDFGIIETLEQMIQNQDRNIKFEFYHNFDDRLPESIELNIYRIIQEAINNINKHANAKSVFIQLIKHENKVSLTIEDDGDGFDQNDLEFKRGGFGLKSMQSRIMAVGGSLEIESSPGGGTMIIAEIII